MQLEWSAQSDAAWSLRAARVGYNGPLTILIPVTQSG